MKLKSVVLASVLALSYGSSLAAVPTYYYPTLSTNGTANWSAGFSATHEAGDFTDIYVFAPGTLSGYADTWFSNQGYTTNAVISFTSATLNGVAVSVTPATTPPSIPSLSAGALGPTYVGGPITLTINGTSFGSASYGGGINVTAVPEPATYGMLMAGLGVLGVMARRRKQG